MRATSKHQTLMKRAKHAKSRAYAPYSGFRVGAAILTENGRIIEGCNVENGSFSLTICAERNAVFSAITKGQSRFRTIAIASDSEAFLPPCGACMQVLSEFNPALQIILTTSDGRHKFSSLDKLFPMPANLKNLARPEFKQNP